MTSRAADDQRPALLVLASTYPRWAQDPEPAFVHELAKRLTDHFRVIALCPHAPGASTRESLDGVEVLRYRYAPERWETLVNNGGIVSNLKQSRWKLMLVLPFVLGQLVYAWKLLKTQRIAVVHAHWLLPQGVIATLLRLLPGRNVPFIVTSHGADLYALKGRALTWLKRLVLRSASATTVVSHAMLQPVEEMRHPADNVRVMPMGVDLKRHFSAGTSPGRDGKQILFVGRLVAKKGVHHLLSAMPEVLRHHPDARLTIAGFGPDRKRLEAQASALDIADAVHFAGPVSQADLPSLYRHAALFVAPFVEARTGDQEGLGLVLVEAIGCGCPVLAGDVPAVRDVFGTDAALHTVDPRDEADLARRISLLLADPAAACARTMQLRTRIESIFDWDTVADRYANLLTEVLAARQSGSH